MPAATRSRSARCSDPGTGFWNIGAALLAPIFDGGTQLHQERGAALAYQQSAEQYRGTVLTAFQNVADTLVALEQDAEYAEGDRRSGRCGQDQPRLSPGFSTRTAMPPISPC